MVPVLPQRARAIHRHGVVVVEVALDELVAVGGVIHKAREVVHLLGIGTDICRKKQATSDYCVMETPVLGA